MRKNQDYGSSATSPNLNGTASRSLSHGLNVHVCPHIVNRPPVVIEVSEVQPLTRKLLCKAAEIADVHGHRAVRHRADEMGQEYPRAAR